MCVIILRQDENFLPRDIKLLSVINKISREKLNTLERAVLHHSSRRNHKHNTPVTTHTCL